MRCAGHGRPCHFSCGSRSGVTLSSSSFTHAQPHVNINSHAAHRHGNTQPYTTANYHAQSDPYGHPYFHRYAHADFDAYAYLNTYTYFNAYPDRDACSLAHARWDRAHAAGADFDVSLHSHTPRGC